MSAIEIRGGALLTMADRQVRSGSLFVDGVRITGVGAAPVGWPADATVLDATGCAVLPGLVQAHVHLCQTLCRGAADDLPLLQWLRERVWPYEASLDERAMRACARVALAELIRGGTTAVLDMGTVHETDALFDEIGRSGLRAVAGKAMMDDGEGVPAGLRETTRASLDESDALAARWARPDVHGGRLGYAYAPRFVLSCSEALLREVAARHAAGARVHTHASEQREEVELVRRLLGADNVAFFDGLGLRGDRTVLAHCVHLTNEERALLAAHGTHVAHCPSSNMKLGSGFAPVPELLAAGVNVALGADGAPCNNNLDAFVELRLAALIHKPRAGTQSLPAWTMLEMATINGARALGLAAEIGTLEVGKRADVVVIDLQQPHLAPLGEAAGTPAIASTLVYAARSTDVRDVLIDGRLLLRHGELTPLTGLDRQEVVAQALEQARRLSTRIR